MFNAHLNVSFREWPSIVSSRYFYTIFLIHTFAVGLRAAIENTVPQLLLLLQSGNRVAATNAMTELAQQSQLLIF